ncbi:hypothetical protein BGX26_011424 [Mortierella sp. AD094]|nr:hypothetical protein BGX26_011424 [Mortierella sp. AD094]
MASGRSSRAVVNIGGSRIMMIKKTLAFEAGVSTFTTPELAAIQHTTNRTTIDAPHLALWDCNGSEAQFFNRDPKARPGTFSFMTASRIDGKSPYVLSALPEDEALASFVPADYDTRSVQHEWVLYN